MFSYKLLDFAKQEYIWVSDVNSKDWSRINPFELVKCRLLFRDVPGSEIWVFFRFRYLIFLIEYRHKGVKPAPRKEWKWKKKHFLCFLRLQAVSKMMGPRSFFEKPFRQYEYSINAFFQNKIYRPFLAVKGWFYRWIPVGPFVSPVASQFFRDWFLPYT